MITNTAYGFSRQLEMSYEDAMQRVKDVLKTEGFGILTEIDVKDTLSTKLQVDFRRYQILGACNPSLAHKALQAELQVGLLLPCNVIVYEEGDGAVVAAFDPEAAMGLANNPALGEVAREARERLQRALESI